MFASRLVFLLVSPNFGEDQMQFLCFKPERSSLRLQFRDCPNDHPKKMLAFARFLPASSDAFQKFLFGNCVVRFDVVSANTSAGPNELSDKSIGYRILWNRLRKIDNCFAKSGSSFFQIVNAFCLWFFADKSRAIIPKRVLDARISIFRFRHSFVIRHSSFELRHFYQAALCNSAYSHALAKTQSRRTVTVETFRTSAISSWLSPPKYLSSTTRPFLESSVASLSSASCRSMISLDSSGETIAASSNSSLSAP